MKLIHTTALALVLLASPAFASMRITNLDTVAHTVEVTGNGAPERRVIQPDDTEYFTGSTTGMISLVADEPAASPAKKGKGKRAAASAHDSVVHADGMLSGIIGNERSSIPADPDNSYAIWPGGHINVQSRTRNGGKYF